VAKDATRPFVVSVGRVQVQAVGTAFDIRLAAAAVEVLVTEGIVKLKQEPLSNAVAVPDSMLAAGQRAVIATKVPEVIAAVPVTKSEIAEALSWRETRFELSNTPLNEALELFNRRSRVKLSLGDESLGALRVSGIYFADNPDGFARLLESSLDVKAVREGDRILFRRP
jgi:transmembrane sensor